MDKKVRAIYDNDLATLAEYLRAGGDANARSGRDNTLLMYAAAIGSIDAMRMLLEHGADPNQKNAFDATVLMWGVYDAERVKLLLAKGADPNARAKSGKTALLLAAMSPSGGEAVELLAAHHADVTAVDGFGVSLLNAGAYSRNITAVRLALAHHADLETKARDGMTPLMNAASAGSIEITKLLLDAGADPNSVSAPPGPKVKHGTIILGKFTPLIVAAPYGPPAVVKMLLDHGAKVEPVDARGMTALHAAVSSEAQNPEIVRLLMAKGADPTFQNSEKLSARDWAAKFARPDVLRAIGHTPPERASADAAKPEAAHTVNQAAARGLSLMETSSNAFFQNSGCVSCHSQNITGMLAGVAREHGIAVDTEAAKQRIAAVKTAWAPQTEGLFVREDPPGGSDMVAYALLGMSGEGMSPDLTTAALARNLAAQQMPDGSWHRGGIARVPVEDSDITTTAMALRSLQLFTGEGTRGEYTKRIGRARTWLMTAKPFYSEERNMRLLGLKWAGAPEAMISQNVRELAAKQRPSGGWGQNDYLPEDAYATGQTLYALAEAGMPAGDAVYRKGTAYLVRTQALDGSWRVVSRSVKFQPYFQGGFPYDHDQWISSMGTAWAAMALATGN